MKTEKQPERKINWLFVILSAVLLGYLSIPYILIFWSGRVVGR